MRTFYGNQNASFIKKLSVSSIAVAICTAGSIASFTDEAQARMFNNYDFFDYTPKKAKKKKKRPQPVRQEIADPTEVGATKKSKKAFKSDPDNTDPVQVVVSLKHQKAKVFKGSELVATTRISSGKRGHSTPTGVFSIIQKNRRHYSNIYNNAPMPYMQRITWSGFALHAGVIPGYPASHGCVRLPHRFARKLFSYTNMGAHIVISNGEKSSYPKPIAHKNLVNPIPKIDESVAPYAENEEDAQNGHLIKTSALVKTAIVANQEESAIEPVAVVAVKRDKEDIVIPSHIMRLQGRTRINAVQQLLNHLGYDVGRPDSDLGPSTRTQIRKYQRDNGLRVTGKITPEFFETLYKDADREDIALGRNPNDPAHAASLKKPLRIMITKRPEMEKVKDVQNILRFLGYFKGHTDGHVGKATRAAIKRFQYDFMMKENGRLSEEVVTRLYNHANWDEPAAGHLYIRQDFKDIFDAPIEISDAEQRLGTHIFTAMDFAQTDSEVRWLGQTLQSPAKKAKKRWNKRKKRFDIVRPAQPAATRSAEETLDRITLSNGVKQKIASLLTPGSSMIVTDGRWKKETGIGTDFIVLNK